MATIKLRSTKVANKLISYCEKRAAERDGVECEPSTAREQFKATRELHRKPDGVQAHHVIQSFKPGEIDPAKANEIGRQLAERIAPGHEALIYTHTDKEHIHNHIVINAVSFEDGRKYHSDRSQLFAIRRESDELCKSYELSVVRESFARETFSIAEYKLVERGERLWKDELRTAIDKGREHVGSLKELQVFLRDQYGIDMKIQNKNVSFLHPEKQKYVRGTKLGPAYTKEALEHEYGKQREGRASAASREQQRYTTGTNELDPILFRGIGSDQGASDHERLKDGHAERQFHQAARGSEESSRSEREDRAGINHAHERDERDSAERRQRSGDSNRATSESRSGRGESRAQIADRLRGSGEPNEAQIQGTSVSRGGSRGKQPDVQPSVHAPASSPVQKGILDALSEAGKAIQRETAKQAQEAQQKRQRELERRAKYQQQDRNRGYER